jgi:hypothetical protein
MINKLFRIGILFIIIIAFACCKTYYISLNSFKEQFSGIDSSNFRMVFTQGPLGDIVDYLANPIDSIQCTDKNNNPFVLENSPSLEIKFIDNKNKKTTFYFDRIIVQDTIITGYLAKSIIHKKSISINNIKQIQIRDGRKDFNYIAKKRSGEYEEIK